MKYRVSIQFIGSTSVIVNADDEADAMDKALEDPPQNDFAYSGYDAGEWYVDEDSPWPAVEALTT